MAALVCGIAVTLLPKWYDTQLAHGLRHSEFRCHCKHPQCHYTIINNTLLARYAIVRRDVGRPLTINSGYRCQIHNFEAGGVDESSHTHGNAIDISFNNLLPLEKETLITACKVNFDYIKIYDNFIHCQVNPR